jgi:excisionase family DNA binding protein
VEKKTTDPILIGRKEAALLLGVSNRTMTNLIRAGELKPVCIGARRLLKHQDLLKFAERSHHKTTPTNPRSSRKT